MSNKTKTIILFLIDFNITKKLHFILKEDKVMNTVGMHKNRIFNVRCTD